MFEVSMRYRNWPLTAKLMLIAGVGTLLAAGIAWLGWSAIDKNGDLAEARIREGLMSSRAAELKHECELAVDLLRTETRGMTPEARLARMRALLGKTFFMRNGTAPPAGYFFAYDYQAMTLMNPPGPELEGKSRWDVQVAGQYVIRDLADVAKKGGGTYLYRWPRPGAPKGPDGLPVAAPKMSYALQISWSEADGTRVDTGWFIGVGVYIDDIDAELATAAETLHAAAAADLASTARVALALLALALVVTVAIARSISRPVGRVRAALDRLAEGRLDGVGDLGRTDEIGQMASALDRAIAGVRAALRADKVDWAAVERQTAGRAELERQLGRASRDLDSVSEKLAAAASETSAQVESVSAAADTVSTGVLTLTSAAEEMAATSGEIAHGAADAAKTAVDAVAASQRSREASERLSTSSAAIAEAAGLIGSIAERTNLLALNAAIEAARAGDAGRGFAVVADEVKELARRTAETTARIHSMIGTIQGDTAAVRDGLAAAGAVIDVIGQATTSIAAATEEQRATTQEMTRTLNQSSQGMQDIASTVTNVAQAARETSAGAEAVRASANELTRIAAGLAG